MNSIDRFQRINLHVRLFFERNKYVP